MNKLFREKFLKVAFQTFSNSFFLFVLKNFVRKKKKIRQKSFPSSALITTNIPPPLYSHRLLPISINRTFETRDISLSNLINSTVNVQSTRIERHFVLLLLLPYILIDWNRERLSPFLTYPRRESFRLSGQRVRDISRR